MWPFSTKENPVGKSLFVGGGAGWVRSPSRKAFITEGYQMNVPVYKSVNEITSAAKAIPIELFKGDKLVEGAHPVKALLKQPNPTQGWMEFLDETLIDRLLFGEQFTVAAGGIRPAELWNLAPMDMAVKPGTGGMASAYIHDKNGRKKSFMVEADGRSDVFFAKLHNPGDYWRGQSPLMAASLAADTHNAGARWNYKLLKNSARPSGLIEFEGEPGPETVNFLREFFKKSIQGEENAGEVPMLSGGAKWVQMDQTARDMDFNVTMKENAKMVALIYGVPIPLIDNDASTYNNVEQAKERLYTDTVIPLMQDFLLSFGNWLLPAFGDDLSFRMKQDGITALEAVRQRRYDRAVKGWDSGVLTKEETRELMGFEPKSKGEFKQTGRAQPETKAERLARVAYGEPS